MGLKKDTYIEVIMGPFKGIKGFVVSNNFEHYTIRTVETDTWLPVFLHQIKEVQENETTIPKETIAAFIKTAGLIVAVLRMIWDEYQTGIVVKDHSTAKKHTVESIIAKNKTVHFLDLHSEVRQVYYDNKEQLLKIAFPEI